MSRNYYYIISGLPDIKLESKNKLSVTSISTEIMEHIHIDDKKQYELLMLSKDHDMFIRAINDKLENEESGVVLNAKSLKEEVNDPVNLPAYLKDFIETYKESKSQLDPIEKMRILEVGYYDYVMDNGHPFVKWYIDFKATLKNIVIWKNNMQDQDMIQAHIVPVNSISKELLNKSFKEGDLLAHLDWYSQFNQALSKLSLMEKEKFIDQFIWEQINQKNQFEYFSSQVLFAYLIKLQMADRWFKLDATIGEQMLAQIIDESKSQILLTSENESIL